MSTRHFVLSNNNNNNSNSTSNKKQKKRFSIDDAFEEETDEAIKVYGSTHRMTTATTNNDLINGECAAVRSDARNYKLVNELMACDSDSLIQQDCYDGVNGYDYEDDPNGVNNRSCFRHPKVRENWRMVLAATTLLFIGIGLLAIGALALAEPEATGLQGAVFLLAGFICFVPGAYHVVYIYLAAKGRRGYHFHNLPLFT